MRNLAFFSLCCMVTVGLFGCGQSGALMLPSDPDYDQRSEYLLYHQKTVTSQQQQSSQSTDQDSGNP